MRLLRTAPSPDGRLRTEEYLGPARPPYAILSHVWAREEVVYADLNTDGPIHKNGYDKILRALGQAAKDGLEYLWIDTCCINKESSAELGEAINAMFKWYHGAQVCYAYLSDVDQHGELDYRASFRRARWFTRGWTLQELLAPQHVEFYDCHWDLIGTKHTMALELQNITKISAEYLLGSPLGSASIAKRMSWAATRVTTRVEDTAYCLLGLFDVDLPMLYGEGEKAFIRLQEEIMRSSDDQSLFAWRGRFSEGADSRNCGLLAPSPLAFEHTGNVAPYAQPLLCRELDPLRSGDNDSASTLSFGAYAMTNRGLSIEVGIYSYESVSPMRGRDAELSVPSPADGSTMAMALASQDRMLAVLECAMESENGYVAIELAPTQESADHFTRSRAYKLFYVDQPAIAKRSIYVRQKDAELKRIGAPFHLIQFRGLSTTSSRISKPFSTALRPGQAFFIDKIGNQGEWTQSDDGRRPKTVAIPKGARLLSACIVFWPTTRGDLSCAFVLLIGSNQSWQLCFDVWRPTSTNSDLDIRALAEGRQSQQPLLQRMQTHFEPKLPGMPMDLEEISVVVTAQPVSHSEHNRSAPTVAAGSLRPFTVSVQQKQKDGGGNSHRPAALRARFRAILPHRIHAGQRPG